MVTIGEQERLFLFMEKLWWIFVRSIKAFSVIKSEKKIVTVVLSSGMLILWPLSRTTRRIAKALPSTPWETLLLEFIRWPLTEKRLVDSKRMVCFLIKEVTQETSSFQLCIFKVWLFLCSSSFRKGCGSCLLITSYVSNEEFAMPPLSVSWKYSWEKKQRPLWNRVSTEYSSHINR